MDLLTCVLTLYCVCRTVHKLVCMEKNREKKMRNPPIKKRGERKVKEVSGEENVNRTENGLAVAVVADACFVCGGSLFLTSSVCVGQIRG